MVMIAPVSLGSLKALAKKDGQPKYFSRGADKTDRFEIDPDGVVHGLILEEGGWGHTCAITHFSDEIRVWPLDTNIDFDPPLPSEWSELVSLIAKAKAGKLQDRISPLHYRDLRGNGVYFLWRSQSSNAHAIAQFALLRRIGGEVKVLGGKPLRELPFPPDVHIDDCDEVIPVDPAALGLSAVSPKPEFHSSAMASRRSRGTRGIGASRFA